jgi:cytochrome c biogenesis protein CcmG, thiol:disulfide interchange protein DsbE
MRRMSSRAAKSTLACGLAMAALALGACGGGDSDEGAGNPESELTADQAQAPIEEAPQELAALREDANQILDEGLEGFEARLAELEGTPVVVNKWASWCGPCREEFPFFQAQAIEREDEVAFLGLLSDDGAETGAQFLEELPLPYPSYLDPDKEIADSFNAGREFPSTVFIDAAGEVTFTKLGPYTDEASLAADIDRYAAPQ